MVTPTNYNNIATTTLPPTSTVTHSHTQRVFPTQARPLVATHSHLLWLWSRCR